MANFINKIRDRFQLEAFLKGYSKGYEYCIKKFMYINGRYVRYNKTDIMVAAGLFKKPKTYFLYQPWIAGFEYGYSTAVANYNVGITDDNDPMTLEEIFDDVKNEFENQKNSWK